MRIRVGKVLCNFILPRLRRLIHTIVPLAYSYCCAIGPGASRITRARSCYNITVNNKEFASCLRGVFGFPITPFHKDLSLDLKGLARNVDEMAAYPFCAMVAVDR